MHARGNMRQLFSVLSRKVKNRGSWESQVHYVWSLITSTVSLTNVWTVPFLMYHYGGGSFIFAYILIHASFGIPLMTLQLSLGQFSSCGAVMCWDFCRLLQGVGYSVMFISLVYVIFYIVVVAWSLSYLMRSTFMKITAWDECDESFSTEWCVDYVPVLDALLCNSTGLTTFPNGTCYNVTDSDFKIAGLWNYSLAIQNKIRRHLPAEDFMNNGVIGVDRNGIGAEGGLGVVQLDLLGSVFMCLVLVALSTSSTLKLLNKLMQVFMGYVYIYLVIFLIIGLTLEGSGDGIVYLFERTNWSSLLTSDLWLSVSMTVMNDLFLSFGMMESLASYNDFKGDVCLHAFICSLSNMFVSIVISISVFAYVGYLAGQRKMALDELVMGGSTMVFATLPSAIANLHGKGGSVLLYFYFFMIFFIGMSTQVYMTLVVECNLLDIFVDLRPYKRSVVAGLCSCIFLLCVPLVTEGGHEIVEVMTLYMSSFNVFLMAFVQVMAVIWVYGYQQFGRDIGCMVGEAVFLGRVSWGCYKRWLTFCWVYVCHIILLAQVFFQASKLAKNRKTDDYELQQHSDDQPHYKLIISVLLNVATLVPLPGNVAWRLVRHRTILNLTLREKIMSLALPSERWGPALLKTRQKWMATCTYRLGVRTIEDCHEDSMMERNLDEDFRRSIVSRSQSVLQPDDRFSVVVSDEFSIATFLTTRKFADIDLEPQGVPVDGPDLRQVASASKDLPETQPSPEKAKKMSTKSASPSLALYSSPSQEIAEAKFVRSPSILSKRSVTSLT